jgi:ParB family chromosome partitioning protein
MTKQSDLPELSRVKLIPLSKIQPPKLTVRREISPESVEDLVESIKKHGIIEPLIVKQVGEDYEIIAGHRRAFAAELAGLKEVPCIIRVGTDITNEMVKLEENLRRKDVNPIEEAHFINQLIETYKLPIEEIAKASGRSQAYIYERLSILKWPQEIIEALEKNLITYSVARELRKIDNETVRKNYLGYAIDGGCSPAMAAAWVRDYEKQKDYYNQQATSNPTEPIAPPEIRIVRTCPICKEEIEARDAQIVYCHPDCLKKIE